MSGWTVVPNGDTSAWKPVAKPSAPVEQSNDPDNAIQRAFDDFTAPRMAPKDETAGQHALRGLGNFGRGIVGGVGGVFAHPMGTVKTFGDQFQSGASPYQAWAEPMVRNLVEHPEEGAESLAGNVAGGALLGKGVGLAGDAGGAIRSAALGDPNVAALKGLRVGPASAKSLSTLKSVEGARPFMQGVESLADAQARVPAAKAEIWSPYKQAIDKIGGKQVMGPDGPTTVGDLENERLQISANLRTLKSGSPEGIQLAAQKGMNQADLLAREATVQSALDPHLAEAGIDPKLIRGTFGDVAQVGGRLSGKSTLAEPSQPYGFGRMLNMRIDNPRSWLGEPAQGLRDLAAGRPLWSGKPTDINIREAFRGGGSKPDFRAPASAMPRYQQPFAQLEANVPGNAGYGDIDKGSMAGLPHLGPTVPPAPRVFAQLPEITTPGEVQPMARYAKPYVEPFDPHFKPVDLAEYRKMFKKEQ